MRFIPGRRAVRGACRLRPAACWEGLSAPRLAGAWSQGIDDLSKEIESAGVSANVYADTQSGALAEALVNAYPHLPTEDRDPLVLVGFSFGADEAIRTARVLETHDIKVALLVTIDPVTPPPIPKNVRVCRNYYQSNGVRDLLPWLRGVAVTGGPGGVAPENIDIRGRADLIEPHTGHDTIAGNVRIHRAVLEQVLAACPPRAAGEPLTH